MDRGLLIPYTEGSNETHSQISDLYKNRGIGLRRITPNALSSGIFSCVFIKQVSEHIGGVGEGGTAY